jgi:TP901 family phage tail tape measure protein
MDEIVSKLGFDVSEALAALEQFDSKLKNATNTLKEFSTVGKLAAEAGIALDTFGKGASQHIDAATKSTESLTVSWGTLSRVVMTQVIVRTLSTIRQEFENTAHAAVDFQRKAAEIFTISDGTTQNAIKDSVRAISDSLNIPLDKTGAAMYQTLSNGITDTAEALEFLNESGKFAKATNSELVHSVDLLSGAMKSYGLGVEDTARISSVMFEAIRAGRITADELGQTFGRVGPRAAQLGVSLEETAAALAAITVKGVKTSESISLLNGVFTGLTKPTTEMSNALNNMGYASAESAIATMGLPGLLQALADSTDKSASSFAKLFPNVRGIGGELALTGRGLKDFSENLRSMLAAGDGFTASKFLEATATDAERVTKEINKLQNAMTVELGQSVLHTADYLFTLAGGADNFISIARNGVPAILGMGTALVTLAGSMKVASMAGTTLSTSLGGLMLLPVAYGAGQSIANWLNTETTSDIIGRLKSIEDASKAASEKFKQDSEEKLSAAKATDKAILNSALSTIRQLNTAYLSDVNAAEAASQKVKEQRKRAYQEIEQAARRAAEVERESLDRAGSLQQQKSSLALDKRISGLSDSDKARFQIKAGQDLTAEAAKNMIAAAYKNDPAAIKRAADEFARARELLGRAKEASPDWASKAIAENLDKQIQAEKQLRDIELQRSQELVVQKNTLETSKEMLNKHVEDTKKQSYQNFLRGYTGDVPQLEKVMGEKYNSPDAVSRGLIDANSEAEKLRRKIATALNPAEAQGLKKQVKEILDAFDEKQDVRGMWEHAMPDDFKANLKNARVEIQTALEKGIDPAKIRPLFDKLKALNDQSQGSLNGRLGFSSSLDVLVRALPLLQQLGKLGGPAPADIQRLQQLEQAIQGMKPTGIGPAIEQGIPPAAQIEAHFQAAANYAMQAAMALAMAPPSFDETASAMAANGGFIYRASGGNVGTDTVPAMLSPGEFVVNAAAASRFTSQLTAMNAGSQPVFRGGGGTTTNVGDVSIVVNESRRPGQTAREINRELFREIRRGTGKGLS